MPGIGAIDIDELPAEAAARQRERRLLRDSKALGRVAGEALQRGDLVKASQAHIESTVAALATLPPGPGVLGAIRSFQQHDLEPAALDPSAPTPPTARERAAAAMERAVVASLGPAPAATSGRLPGPSTGLGKQNAASGIQGRIP
jgi:hypothetical protein